MSLPPSALQPSPPNIFPSCTHTTCQSFWCPPISGEDTEAQRESSCPSPAEESEHQMLRYGGPQSQCQGSELLAQSPAPEGMPKHIQVKNTCPPCQVPFWPKPAISLYYLGLFSKMTLLWRASGPHLSPSLSLPCITSQF